MQVRPRPLLNDNAFAQEPFLIGCLAHSFNLIGTRQLNVDQQSARPRKFDCQWARLFSQDHADTAMNIDGLHDTANRRRFFGTADSARQSD
jgi:hypothetical protein